MADLKGGTTGQILSKATNADMDFTWITNDVGDITAVNVTAPITGGGTSGAVTIGVSAASTSASGVVQLSDSTSTTSSVLASTPTATKAAYDLANTASTTATAAIPKSTVTTAGDIIFRNGSAPTRLGIGTAGQVLTVNSGATAPEWATPTGSTWTTWSPTYTGLTVGNGTITARYNTNNNVVYFQWKLVFGSTSSISGDVTVSLPLTANTSNSLAQVSILDEFVAYYVGIGLVGTTSVLARVTTAGGTYVGNASLSSTVPMTWNSGDSMVVAGFYEKA
jgi:hypothetical protein